MELKQLRIFLAVAEELHFGRAAERLHMAQPALSAQVRGLEDELGVRLFLRTTRRVSLTRAGESFLPEARATLAQAEAAAAAARAVAGEGAELLKVGGVDSATAGLLPQVVRRFRRDYPEVEIKVNEMLSAPALHALSNRHLDIAFVRIWPKDSHLKARHVLTEPIVVALPADHRLASRKTVPVAEIAKEPLVIPARSHRPILFDVIHDYFRSRGHEPRILQEANERHVIIAMVAAGLGLSLVPQWVTQFQRDDVVYRPLQDGGPLVEVYVVWRDREVMQSALAFLDYLPGQSAD
ncbi:LysR family transcriptional regulator [Pelagibius litoralis]|uniref:LysR family transcriptional regulator n=1 Tax=Pelagibius litoralis TaxID=374515 RepID=A0A967C7T4_9PROT|nr:LysR family transcriptional regulator [Pelagibius litoralis]NIA67972.1 LysR family transcriptional regulator [Pelagibius litoralis]